MGKAQLKLDPKYASLWEGTVKLRLLLTSALFLFMQIPTMQAKPGATGLRYAMVASEKIDGDVVRIPCPALSSQCACVF
jgi:hypothetical protein